MTDCGWPPEFTLRKSKKAKRASIRISLYRKIEVVVPEKTRFFDPHAFLDQHKSWILKHLATLPPLPEYSGFQIPQEIAFPGLGCQYQVVIKPDATKSMSLRRGPGKIIFSGDISNGQAAQDKLISWLNQEAGAQLLPQVRFLSEKHGLIVDSLRVRFMKTRWGSCNREGRMTLNSQLAFLPLPLIHHVILHELCHTRYMSHGPRFWGLLSKLDPQAEVHDKAMGKCQQYIPQWCMIA